MKLVKYFVYIFYILQGRQNCRIASASCELVNKGTAAAAKAAHQIPESPQLPFICVLLMQKGFYVGLLVKGSSL